MTSVATQAKNVEAMEVRGADGHKDSDTVDVSYLMRNQPIDKSAMDLRYVI